MYDPRLPYCEHNDYEQKTFIATNPKTGTSRKKVADICKVCGSIAVESPDYDGGVFKSIDDYIAQKTSPPEFAVSTPLFRCSKCEDVFEPPFDSQKFQIWMDACEECEEVDAYLCLKCADLE